MNGASLTSFAAPTRRAGCYLSRMKIVLLGMLALAACAPTGSDSEAPDAAVDAGIDSPPPEPKPMFAASPYLGGNLAIDDVGIRATYKKGAVEYKSNILVSLTEAGKMTSCSVTLAPSFVSFGSANTSTRSFKTVVIDFAHSTVIDDKCKWDDAWIASQLDEQFGHFIIGFAQARFTEDQPYLDVYLDADKPLPNSTANITMTGHGTAYAMNPDGGVTFTQVQPAAGTLLTALYGF
jgi:hypothetical protein